MTRLRTHNRRARRRRPVISGVDFALYQMRILQKIADACGISYEQMAAKYDARKAARPWVKLAPKSWLLPIRGTVLSIDPSKDPTAIILRRPW